MLSSPAAHSNDEMSDDTQAKIPSALSLSKLCAHFLQQPKALDFVCILLGLYRDEVKPPQ